MDRAVGPNEAGGHLARPRPRRRRYAVARAIAAAAVALLLALFLRPDAARVAPDDAPHAAAPPIAVDVSGCAALHRPAVCELAADRTVRLVTPPDTGNLHAYADTGADVEQEQTPVDGGVRWRLRVPDGATRIVLETPEHRAVFALAIATPPRAAALDKARELRAAGALDQAATTLSEALPSLDPDARARATGLLARIDLARGDEARGIEGLREAMQAHAAEGRPSLAADDGCALAYVLIQRHRLAEARDALTAIDAIALGYPDGRARLHFYEGYLAGETGDTRRTLRLLAQAEDESTRLGLDSVRRMVAELLSRRLPPVGRADEARARLVALAGARWATSTACDRGKLLHNTGWTELLAREYAQPEVGRNAARSLARAVLALENGCGDPQLLVDARVDLAWATLQDGDAAGASAELAAARSSGVAPSPFERPILFEVEGRLALARRDPKGALAAFGAEAGSLIPEWQWRAHVGSADAWLAAGRPEAALDEARIAESLLDGALFAIPLGDGREAFLAGHERSARIVIELLAARGRIAEAAHAARIAQTRPLRRLAQQARLSALAPDARARWDAQIEAYLRDRAALDADASREWRLPFDEVTARREKRRAAEGALRARLADALAILETDGPRDAPRFDPPPAGTLLLALHPVTQGWLAFAIQASGAAHAATIADDGDARAIATKALTAFEPLLAGASRVRVLPYGAMQGVDFHALPFRAATLLDAMPVEYTLGLPTDDARAPSSGPALVAADPVGDLAAAAQEIDAVIAWARPRAPARILARDEATTDALRSALAAAGHFHFAGHGRAAGRDAWESALVLGRGSTFAVADILTLPRVPETAVLSACEAAHGTAATTAPGLGIAQAFLVAGARSVVAPSRIVNDDAAARLVRALYTHASRTPVDGAPSWDGAALLRAAQIELRGQTTDVDAFRASVR
jgi:hypothetical protein